MRANQKLTIGHGANNDIIVYGDGMPKSHTLIEFDAKAFALNISGEMSGEIRYGDSNIHFRDLIKHEILPRKGHYYILHIKNGRSGYVKIHDAEIHFLYDGADGSLKTIPSYSWTRATFSSLGKDVIFKLLFTIFISLEVMLGIYLGKIEIPPEPPPDIAKVPQRFAKFIIQRPAEQPKTTIVSDNGTASVESEEETEESGQKQQQKRSGGGGGDRDGESLPVTSRGLLGLIGGTGNSGNASAAADFLIDQGLVQELDQMLGKKPLIKGKGSGVGSGTGNGVGSGDGLDDLMSIGLSGGIDDLLSEVSGVETVGLSKKTVVNIEQPQKIRGSQTAVGQRSPENVMARINAEQARIEYTYNKYLRDNPSLRGKISLDVTLEADGSISKVVVVSTDITNTDFVNDIVRIIKRIKFPPITEGDVTINLPFVFNRFE
ncbi:hypothetical protein A2V82_07920 [candidate division KSB1 bacterium RBG_16_48_16]|nr:MAG: hypothetical protein A2V82_07920 [candidate division KSB1 bacterium RBG_16_48_16]